MNLLLPGFMNGFSYLLPSTHCINVHSYTVEYKCIALLQLQMTSTPDPWGIHINVFLLCTWLRIEESRSASGRDLFLTDCDILKFITSIITGSPKHLFRGRNLVMFICQKKPNSISIVPLQNATDF